MLWRRCGHGGDDDAVPRSRIRPGSGRFTAGMLSWLVRQARGEQLVWCRRRRDSRAREVYEAVTVSGARLVIRGVADDGIGLDQEAWFLDHARQAGVPAPEVLWLGAADTPAGPQPVMVQTAAAGRVLAGMLPGMSAGQRRSAARSCGQAAGQVHELLPEAVAARGDGPAVLCHGDLIPDHVFVTAGADAVVTVTGLIDFGDACGGRPLDDMAVLCRNWPGVDRAALAAGYGPAPFWDDHGRRLALAQLRLLIGFTAYDLRTGKTAEAGRDLADLKALLASPAVR